MVIMTTTTNPVSTQITLPAPLDDPDDLVALSPSTTTSSDSDSELMTSTAAAMMGDDVTAQLAAAGPIGMAAAAAIASAKKRKRPHSFETNPSIRKRQQTRLLRKLRQTIDEFTIRVGMQAVVLVAIPGKQNNCFKCFGAKPLEDVVRGLRPVVMQDLEQALAQAAPVPAPEDPSLHELPPLVIDGIPTPVEKMTQAQLRAFIPLMLKYSTGRGKPGWGKESTRPGWWPGDLPWANVRMDARSEDEKQKVSWTHALRQIVVNCYTHHSREDLLPVFSGDHPPASQEVDVKPAKLPRVQQQQQLTTEKMFQICEFLKQQHGGGGEKTVLQTISNLDGSVSLVQVEGGGQGNGGLITLPDGTTAQVQGVATLQHSTSPTPTTINIDLSQLQNLDHSQQLIITGEDGRAYPVTVSGMISVPLTATGPGQWGGAGSGAEQPGQVQKPRLRPRKSFAISLRSRRRIITTTTAPTTTQSAPPLLLPKLEPPEPQPFPSQIPVSALTGDPSQTQLVAVSATGQVVHEDKVYQICEYGYGGGQRGEGDGESKEPAAES